MTSGLRTNPGSQGGLMAYVRTVRIASSAITGQIA
jgi:hypothetical protein